MVLRGLSFTLPFILLLAGVFSPSGLPGAELLIEKIVHDEGRRYIDMRALSYQREDILEAVKRGIEARLTFTLQLFRDDAFSMIYKKSVYAKQKNRLLKYDFWNRSYIIIEGNKKTPYHNENEVLSGFFSIQRWEIPETTLVPGTSYRLRAKAQLESVDLYFPMNLVFKYVVGYWDFDTGWVYGPSIKSLR